MKHLNKKPKLQLLLKRRKKVAMRRNQKKVQKKFLSRVELALQ
jgi:hypothetical protein